MLFDRGYITNAGSALFAQLNTGGTIYWGKACVSNLYVRDESSLRALTSMTDANTKIILDGAVQQAAVADGTVQLSCKVDNESLTGSAGNAYLFGVYAGLTSGTKDGTLVYVAPSVGNATYTNVRTYGLFTAYVNVGMKITDATVQHITVVQTGDFATNAALDAEIAARQAADAGLVTLATNQTISGLKTFSSDVLPSGSAKLGTPNNVWSYVYTNILSNSTATAIKLYRSLEPYTSSTIVNLGTASKPISDIYTGGLSATGSVSLGPTTVTGDVLPSVTATYSLGSNATGSVYKWKDLYLSGNASIGGTLGAGTTTLGATSTYSLKPRTDATYDLGSNASGSEKRWKDLYLSGTAYADTFDGTSFTGNAATATSATSATSATYATYLRSGSTNVLYASSTTTVRPSANNAKYLGSSSYKFANVYSTKFTGDLEGTADKATGDEDGNDIKDSYGASLSSSSSSVSTANKFIRLKSKSGENLSDLYISDIIANSLRGSGGVGSSASTSSFGTTGTLGLFILTRQSGDTAKAQGSTVSGGALAPLKFTTSVLGANPTTVTIGAPSGYAISGTWYVLNYIPSYSAAEKYSVVLAVRIGG